MAAADVDDAHRRRDQRHHATMDEFANALSASTSPTDWRSTIFRAIRPRS
jgi:hypothetical protein